MFHLNLITKLGEVTKLKLKLQKSKQKELIHNLKGKKSWIHLANSLGIKLHVLTDLAKERTLISENLFRRLDEHDQYTKYITEKRYNNWGQIKGGNNSTGTTKQIIFPKKDERLAELIGIILGDGNIHIFKGKKSTSYILRIAGDSNKDKEYLINYVKPLCDSLFELDSKIIKHKSANELFVNVNSKKVVEFLLSVGMCAGNKIMNQVTIPSWIYGENKLLKACIRGLVDTDGSVYELKPHWPGIWQICFTNKNQKLMNDFRNALIKLDIGCSKIYSKIGTPKMYITKKSELRKFYKEIGFSNIKHKNKLQPRGVAD